MMIHTARPRILVLAVMTTLFLGLAGTSSCRAGDPSTADGGIGGNTDPSAAVDAGPDSRADPPVITPIGDVTVETVAGSDQRGEVEGTGQAAQFNNPVGVAIDAAGTLFVTEYDGWRVRRVDATGTTFTVARGIPEPFALLPVGDSIYVQTDLDKEGRKRDDSGTIWKVNPTTGTFEVVLEGLSRPRGLALLLDGRIVIADRERHTLRILNLVDRSFTLLAGSGVPGFRDGFGEAAQFNAPYGLAVLPDGNIIVADSENHCLRKVTLAGEVTVIAGDRLPGMRDDPDKLKARFDRPVDVAADAEGALYISDSNNHRIRRISPAGVLQTVAGDGTRGFLDGAGTSARFFAQEQLIVTKDGRTVYVSDGSGGEEQPFHRVRRINIPR